MCQNRRCGADCGNCLSAGCESLYLLHQKRAGFQIRRAGNPAGKYQHIVLAEIKIFDNAIRHYLDAVRRSYPGIICNGYKCVRDSRACQKIGHSQRFDCFKAFREKYRDLSVRCLIHAYASNHIAVFCYIYLRLY